MINLLTPYPAALIRSQNERIMVIADLHIGWEIALANKGIHVPTQTPKLLRKTIDLLSTYKPGKLLILGDVKHTVATAEKIEWRDVPDFFNELRKFVKKISVIRGNHDGNLEPLLPEDVEILPSAGVTMDEIGLFHGHQWPSPNLLRCKSLVMGHIHPVVAFRDPAGFRVMRQVWVKTECNTVLLTRVLLQKRKTKIEGDPVKTLEKHYKIKPKTSQLFIMPSFNDFLGGRPLNERKPLGKTNTESIAGPVLRSDAVDMKNAETYLLDGTYLGTVQQLRTLA